MRQLQKYWPQLRWRWTSSQVSHGSRRRRGFLRRCICKNWASLEAMWVEKKSTEQVRSMEMRLLTPVCSLTSHFSLSDVCDAGAATKCGAWAHYTSLEYPLLSVLLGAPFWEPVTFASFHQIVSHSFAAVVLVFVFVPEVCTRICSFLSCLLNRNRFCRIRMSVKLKMHWESRWVWRRNKEESKKTKRFRWFWEFREQVVGKKIYRASTIFTNLSSWAKKVSSPTTESKLPGVFAGSNMRMLWPSEVKNSLLLYWVPKRGENSTLRCNSFPLLVQSEWQYWRLDGRLLKATL